MLICSAVCLSQDSHQEFEKTWTFQGRSGAVGVRVTSFSKSTGDRYASLAIYSLDGAPRSTSEEADFLAIVLSDLPKEGIKPETLSWISFRLNEPEAISAVAQLAALSSAWRPALKSHSAATIYPLVTTFVNESGAYKKWNEVFEEHGFTLQIAGVEKVIMAPFSQSNAKCPKGADCQHLMIPVDALVQMNISRRPN
jgi:hypothetical protein